MSEWIDREALEKTLASYNEAMDRVFMCGKVEPRDTNNGGLPTRFRAWRSLDRLLPHATDIYATHESLFEYGRPKQIGPYYSTWRSSFFTVNVSFSAEWRVFEWHPGLSGHDGFTDDDGEYHAPVESRPAELKPHHVPRRITVEFGRRSWGLEQWRRDADEIRGFMDAAPQEIREHYAERYAKADAEVTRWQEAIRKLAAVTIPT